MKNGIIAMCGLKCSECPAYRATQTNDPQALNQVLIQWQEAYSAPHITVDDILCDGCLPPPNRLNGYCRHCQVRACAVESKLTNCAHCSDYPCTQLDRLLSLCDRQEGLFSYARHARGTLEMIRNGVIYP
jgi:hypothetical protein